MRVKNIVANRKLKQVFVPDTAGMWTQLAQVLKGKRAHLEPAAASCTFPVMPRNASRLHSKRHGDKWRFPRLHLKPEK